MTTAKVSTYASLLACLLLAPMAHSFTLFVNCNSHKGPPPSTASLSSIGAALKLVQNAGPNTINVSGACHENLLIKDTSLLTIAGSSGASLSDASGGTADVIDLRNSQVTITGMTIDGLGSI